MKKTTSLLLILLLLLTTLLGGCGADSSESAAAPAPAPEQTSTDASKVETTEATTVPQGGTIRIAYWNAPSGILAPGLTTNSYDFYVYSLMFESLLRFDPSYELESYLAESYQISEDQKTITFKLKEGVLWHDGVEFTAEDVKFTYEFLGHPDYPGSSASHLPWLEGAEAYKNGEVDHISGIKVIDPYTISITTTEPFGGTLHKFGTTSILAKHIWESVEVAKALEATDLLKNPIGTGPFKMSTFVADQYVELVANEDYRNGKPNLDKVIILAANPETAQAQILNGDIDFMLVSQLNQDDLDLYAETGIQVQTVMLNSNQYMGFNNALEVFKDKKVRQAMMYAIDRQGIVDGVLSGFGVVASQPYRSDFWATSDQLNDYPYDPQKAIALFEESGWNYDETSKLMMIDNKPAKFFLKYPSGNKAREQSAVVIQQNLKDIGIEIELQIMEFNTLYEQVKEGDYELYLMAEGASTGDPDIKRFYHTDFTYPTGLNTRNYSNPKVDELFEQGEKLVDVEDQKPVYQEISKLLNEDVPLAYLYFWFEGRAINGKLNGVKCFAGNNYYDIENWYLEN